MIQRIKSAISDESPQQADLDLDTVLSMLSNRRRRLTTRYLVEDMGSDDDVDLGDIAEYIAAIESDRGVNFTSEERKAAYVSLYQSHRHLLIDAEVMVPTGGRQNRRYCRGPNAEAVCSIIDHVEEVTGGEA